MYRHSATTLEILRPVLNIAPEQITPIINDALRLGDGTSQDFRNKLTPPPSLKVQLISQDEMREFHRKTDIPFGDNEMFELSSYLDETLDASFDNSMSNIPTLPSRIDKVWVDTSPNTRRKKVISVAGSNALYVERATLQQSIQEYYGLSERVRRELWWNSPHQTRVTIVKATGRGLLAIEHVRHLLEAEPERLPATTTFGPLELIEYVSDEQVAAQSK